MDTPRVAGDPEFAAMQTVFKALEPLDEDSRQRVLEYIAARLKLALRDGEASSTTQDGNGVQAAPDEALVSERNFATLAELHDAANARSHRERVLVAAYWAQVCEGADSFVSYGLNKALKDLGHGVPNVTGAIDALRKQKPALVLQLKKAGKSRQARKTYKITEAGVAAVRVMIDG